MEAKTPATQTGRRRRNKKSLQTPSSEAQNALDASVEKSLSSKKGRPKHKIPAPILFSSDEDSDDVFAPPSEKETKKGTKISPRLLVPL